MTRFRVLVASSDLRTLRTVAGDLARTGYDVARADGWAKAVQMVSSLQPDLVVQDHPLKGCQESCLTTTGQDVPRLMLIARDCTVDTLAGFRLGVDDYQLKPFSRSELILRVKAVLYRRSILDSLTSHLSLDRIEFPDLQIDPRSRVVRVNKTTVELTNKEFDLLWALASKPNQVLSRPHLLTNVWHYAFPGDESTVTVHIHRLREKLEKDPANPRYIKTARGRGYKFEIAQ